MKSNSFNFNCLPLVYFGTAAIVYDHKFFLKKSQLGKWSGFCRMRCVSVIFKPNVNWSTWLYSIFFTQHKLESMCGGTAWAVFIGTHRAYVYQRYTHAHARTHSISLNSFYYICIFGVDLQFVCRFTVLLAN